MKKYGLNVTDLIKHMNKENNRIHLNNNQYNRKHILYTGYFHGYKAYRLILKRQGTTGGIIKKFSKSIHINDFQEIKLLYNLDNYLKLLIYPYIMQLGTAIKSYLIETIAPGNNADFTSIFLHHTIFHKFNISATELNQCSANLYRPNYFTRQLAKRCNVKTYVMSQFVNTYKKCKHAIYNSDSASSILLLKDYKRKNESIPIWTILEFITFGNLMFLIRFLLPTDRKNLQKNMGTYGTDFNPAGRLLNRHMILLRFLRNAIAHNSVIFDCRFNIYASREIKARKHLQRVTGIPVNFQHIEDYIILIFYYLYKMSDMQDNAKYFRNTLRSLLNHIKRFRHDTYKISGHKKGKSIFDSIFGTDVFKKINKLLKLLNNYDNRSILSKILSFFH